MSFLDAQLAQFTPELIAMTRRSDPGFDWTTVTSDLEVLRNIAVAINETEFRELPDAVVQTVQQQLATVVTLAGQAAELDYTADPNAHNTRASIAQQIAQHKATWTREVRPHARPVVEVGTLLSDLRAAVSQATSEMQTLAERKAEAEATFGTADRLLEKVQRLAGEVGAGELSRHYRQQVVARNATAKSFATWAAIALATLAVVAAVSLYTLDTSVNASPLVFTRDVLARLFLLGLGGYVVAFLARGYRTNTHLAIVNEQKANALDTYVLFQEAATTEEAREAITVELVRTVFATSESGYLEPSHDRTIVQEQSAAAMSLLASRLKS